MITGVHMQTFSSTPTDTNPQKPLLDSMRLQSINFVANGFISMAGIERAAEVANMVISEDSSTNTSLNIDPYHPANKFRSGVYQYNQNRNSLRQQFSPITALEVAEKILEITNQ